MALADSDRELLYEQLSRQAAAGAIDLDELERRVAAVSGAQTREQALAALADLPPLAPNPGTEPRAPAPRLGWKPSHGEADAAAPDWQPTPERFRDPRTGRVMRVWEDAAGGRHYLPDREP
ncbi:MAG: DUF1707 SHOCT-like domain-containing protein [Solirubrobacteraceae bacterium]